MILHYAVMQVTVNIDVLSYPSNFCNEGKLDASLNQPQMSFGGEELYPTLLEPVS